MGSISSDVSRELAKARRDLRSDLRSALWVDPSASYTPPPVDVEAEELVVSALLCGQSTPTQLGAEARHFGVRLHRAIVSYIEALEDRGMLDGEPNLVTLVALFSEDGIDRARAAHDLIRLRDTVPFTVDLPDQMERLVEMYHRRRVVKLMATLDAAMRTGGDISAETVRELRHLLDRWGLDG